MCPTYCRSSHLIEIRNGLDAQLESDPRDKELSPCIGTFVAIGVYIFGVRGWTKLLPFDCFIFALGCFSNIEKKTDFLSDNV